MVPSDCVNALSNSHSSPTFDDMMKRRTFSVDWPTMARSTAIITIVVVLIVCNTMTDAACATTNSDGTCASCADPSTQYGPQCLDCPCTVIRGTCNAGVNGNGRCSACETRRFGMYCERSGWKSSLLLDWIQFNVGISAFAMGLIVWWVYFRIFTAVRAERQYLSSNADRIQQFASASRVAYAIAASEKRHRDDEAARSEAALPEKVPKEVSDNKSNSPLDSEADEPGIRFFGADGDAQEPAIHHDGNDAAIVNIRSPQPKEHQRRHDPFDDLDVVPSARLFASNSRSRSYDPSSHQRANYQQTFDVSAFGSPFPRDRGLRQAPSLSHDDNGLTNATGAVSRGGGPGGHAASQQRRRSNSYNNGFHYFGDDAAVASDAAFGQPSENFAASRDMHATSTQSPPGASIRPQRSSHSPERRETAFMPDSTVKQPSQPSVEPSAPARPLGMTTKELLRSPSPLPRFRPGDRVRRNARHVAAMCDFGGDIGDVLCGECITISTIIVKRDADKGVSYSFTAVGGDQEPAVPFTLEDLFDVASSDSSSSESS